MAQNCGANRITKSTFCVYISPWYLIEYSLIYLGQNKLWLWWITIIVRSVFPFIRLTRGRKREGPIKISSYYRFMKVPCTKLGETTEWPQWTPVTLQNVSTSVSTFPSKERRSTMWPSVICLFCMLNVKVTSCYLVAWPWDVIGCNWQVSSIDVFGS